MSTPETPIQVDLGRIAQDLQIRRVQVESVVELLDEGNTVPFITRYRKERTGNLDETVIREIQRRVGKLRELAERKETILRSIEAQGKLTEELAGAIRKADNPKRLEDLYLPYKPKKKTKASEAREKGLEPLAVRIWNRDETLTDLQAVAPEFLNPEKGLDSVEKVLEGVGHILAESISELANVRDTIRRVVWRAGKIVTSKAENLQEGQGLDYRDYFDYSEPVGHIPPHRVLAINRGDKEGPLKVRLDVPREELGGAIQSQLPLEGHPQSEFFTNAAFDSLERLLMPSIEREVRRDLTEMAERHAVTVFARNLRSLLLQPPINKQVVLALDPGFRTGCKVAVLDANGNLLDHGVIHPHPPQNRRHEAKLYLKSLVGKHNVEVVAIGNGTACRETEELIAEIIAEGTKFTEEGIVAPETPPTSSSTLTPEPPATSDAEQSPDGGSPEATSQPAEVASETAPASETESPVSEPEAAQPADEAKEPTTPPVVSDSAVEPEAVADQSAAPDSNSNSEPSSNHSATDSERVSSTTEQGNTTTSADSSSSDSDQDDSRQGQGPPPSTHAEALPPISGGEPDNDEEENRRDGDVAQPDDKSSPADSESQPDAPSSGSAAESETSDSEADRADVLESSESTENPADEDQPKNQGQALGEDSSSGETATESPGSETPKVGDPQPVPPMAEEPATAASEAPVESTSTLADAPIAAAADADADASIPADVPPSLTDEGDFASSIGGDSLPQTPGLSEAPTGPTEDLAVPTSGAEPAPQPTAEAQGSNPAEHAAALKVGLTSPPIGPEGTPAAPPPAAPAPHKPSRQKKSDQPRAPKGPPPPPAPHPADPVLARLAYVIVNEAGASVYSASPVGKEEFPDFDATLRGTISIGRRLQDPLSELVKIEPQNIGVGLYQHDVNPKQLKESLESVIESCVNFVGVDLNTASVPLLRHVSGLNQLTARRIVERRQQGPFARREQIKDIEGVGPATFTQAAGFLKVRNPEAHPFDRTWIHPESYEAAEKLLAKLGFEPKAITEKDQLEALRAKLSEVEPTLPDLARELEIGEPTLLDIFEALARPERDPREDLPKPIFKKGVLKLEDLQAGMELKGTVLNVVDFGAFVDIGLKDSGLVHISQLANRYVKSPHDVVSVGDVVTVWVMKVEHDRKRVSLTMVEPGSERPRGPAGGGGPGQSAGAGAGARRGADGGGGGGGERRGRGPRREAATSLAATTGTPSGDAVGQGGAPGPGPGGGGGGRGGRVPGAPSRYGAGAAGGRGQARGGGAGGGGYRGGQRGGRSGPQSADAERHSTPRPARPKPSGPPEPLSTDALTGSVPLRSFGQLKQLWQARTTEPGEDEMRGDERSGSAPAPPQQQQQHEAPPAESEAPSTPPNDSESSNESTTS